ncbi:MAG: type II secretion system protein [bacterium]
MIRPRTQRPCPAKGRAFTLVELLVVISVITLLASITLPVTMRASAESRRVACRNNLKQVYGGLQYYANQWNQCFPANYRRHPIPAEEWQRGDDDLSALYDRYVGDIRVFNCPATTDNARERDMEVDGKTVPEAWDIMYVRTETHPENDESGQLSYEYLGEVEPRQDMENLDTSKAWIMHDDDGMNVDHVVDGDNHGSLGGNMLFVDGRVLWIPAMDWTETVWAGHNEVGEDGEWDKATGWPILY